MANSNFIVQNGLTVGPLTISAATGDISTPGNVSITGNLGVSQISKNDSSISINDTGTGSNVNIIVDGTQEAYFTTSGMTVLNTIVADTLNAKTVGNTGATVTAATVNAATIGNSGALLTGTLQTAAQTNITSVGTLTGLTLSGTLTGTTINAATIGNVGAAHVGASVQAATIGNAGAAFTGASISAATIGNSGATLTGTLQTAAQTNITSVGTLTGLTVSGTLTGATINAATIGNSGAAITGTLQTAAQTNITSVGTLTGLTLSGTLTGTTINAATIGNVGAAHVGASVQAATIGNSGALITGTLQTAAQTNITSVGTLSALATSGDITVGGNLTVNGTTVTVNATTITTNDKAIVLANNQSTSAGIDGSGIDAGGGTPIATFRYNNATTSWQSNVGITPAATNTLALGGASNYWNNIYSTTHTGTTGTFTGTVTAATVNAATIGNSGATLTGTLQTAAQTNITSVGTLTGLTLSGTLTGTTINAATIGNSGATLTGTLQTAAQTNITSVGLLSSLAVSGAINSGTSVTAPYFTSNVATGTAPLTVASTTVVSNLNADLWDGNHFSSYLNQAVLSSSSPTFAGITLPSITHSGTDGVGNIGASGAGFNTVFAKATSAQYADLAENYSSDAEYEPGTVVCFGGEAEVTLCDTDHCRKVAGVVSTDPAYLMNSALAGVKAAVALQGRVPCKVIGPVQKGDMMVSAGNGRARAEAEPKLGAVIGKALEDFAGTEGVIEVVIGRV